jgi:cell division protein FtsL
VTRFNLLLLAIAVACSLGAVTAQHHSRVLFVELEREQAGARQLEDDWGRLQLEQSTWAMHQRIEMVASQRLRMRVPPASRVQIIDPAAAAGEAAR